jgi:hypothetical protein
VREGTLQKKGKLRWQSRWFSAAGHYIRYWDTQEEAGDDAKLLAAIDVNQIDIDDPNEEGVFKLRSWEEINGKRKDGKDILLKASTPLLAVEWVTALRQLQQSASGNVSTEAPPPAPPTGTPRQKQNYSIASDVTLNELDVLEIEMAGYEERLRQHCEMMAGSAVEEELLVTKGSLAQMNGILEKFQFVKVDSVTTGNLNSGKDEAKQSRKNLNKRAEALSQNLLEASKFCDRIIGGDVAGGSADAQRMMAQIAAADATVAGVEEEPAAKQKPKAKVGFSVVTDSTEEHPESAKAQMKKRMTPHVKTNHKLWRDDTGDDLEDLSASDMAVEGDDVGGREVKFGGGVKFADDGEAGGGAKSPIQRRGTPHRNQLQYMEDSGEVREFSAAELSADDMEFLNAETMRVAPEPLRKVSFRKSRPPPPSGQKPVLPDGGAKRASYLESTEEDKIRRLTVSALDPEMLVGLEAPAEGENEVSSDSNSDSDGEK